MIAAARSRVSSPLSSPLIAFPLRYTREPRPPSVYLCLRSFLIVVVVVVVPTAPCRYSRFVLYRDSATLAASLDLEDFAHADALRHCAQPSR